MEKDPFDEFEFKPINQGLGFQKKSTQFKKELDVTQSMPSVSLPLKQPLKNEAPQPARMQPAPQAQPISKPQLPFHDFASSRTQAPAGRSTIAPSPQAPAPSMRRPETSTAQAEAQIALAAQARANARAAQAQEFRPQVRAIEDVSVHFPAIIFDSIVVIGLTCLFAAAVLLVVEVDLLEIIQIARTDAMTSLSLVLLCISVLELYLIIFRSFLGATLGEWAFDVQLGTKAQQASAYYPLRVILRSIVTIVTGFVLLPILSFILNRDLAGDIMGLRLKRGEPIG